MPRAQEYGLHPLLLWSLIRQESLYEGFVRSTAGARGLMQIIPSTGDGIYSNLGWPEGYTSEDLYRPVINVPFGVDYLHDQWIYLNGDIYAALAGYNGGPGNAQVWQSLSGGDPDLFLEIVRFEETRNYIRGVYEIFSIYRRIYDRTP
jgi:soluble lytic murein transglycosylase